MRRAVLALVLSALVACAFEPTGLPIPPPAIYRQWYAELKACSGLSGNFDAIHWQTAPQIHKGLMYYTGWWTPRHTITVRDDWASDERLIKHEEMHDLRQDGAHPDEYFKGRCGDLMSH